MLPGIFEAVGEPFFLLNQVAGTQANHQDRQGYRRNLNEKLREVPAHDRTDQQVLRLAHQCADTAQGGTDRTVHHQIPEKSAELFQVFLLFFLERQVAGQVVCSSAILAGYVAVVDLIKAVRHRNDDRGNGEGIEEGREKGTGKAEQEGDFILGLHLDQNTGKGEAKEILHEVNAGDHEDQEQDDLEVGQGFVVHGLGLGHADEDSFHRKQAARRQGIAFQGHCQGEDKFTDQNPAGKERPVGVQQDGVDHQKRENGELVPEWGIAKKVIGKCFWVGQGHRLFSLVEESLLAAQCLLQSGHIPLKAQRCMATASKAV